MPENFPSSIPHACDTSAQSSAGLPDIDGQAVFVRTIIKRCQQFCFDLDSDGFYYFRGRADDLVKVSGQWVYPLEVELCLADHPDVRECAVMAYELPDRRMTLHAWVVLKNGDADAVQTKRLQDFVKTRLLPHKYPRKIDFLPELPKTGTGKIDRQSLLRGR